MPSDDKSKYDDDDIFTRDEEDLFKKYSSKEGKNYRNEKDNSGNYGNEKDFEAKLRSEKDFSGNYDNFDDRSGDKEDKDFGFDNEVGSFTGLKKENRAGSSKDTGNEDFFKDEDFTIKDFEEEEQYDDGGFRSIKTKKKKRRTRMIISSLVIMAVLVVIAIGIVYGFRFIKNKYFSKTEDTTVATEQSIVVPGSMKLGKDLSIVICGAGDNLLEPDINSVIFSKYTSAKTELISLCVPTNTLFEIPGFGLDSIKKSVEYGGMDLVKLSLKNNIGMDVNNYLLMDILNIVNKLEGIKLTLDKALTISTPEGTKIDLKEGDNILNGETALSFMKYYSGNTPELAVSDVRMQKMLIDSIMRKIVGSKDGELAKNLTRITDLMDTDLNLEELSEFISTAAGISDENNKYYALDGRFESTDEEGTIVFVPDIARVLDIFKQESSVPVDTTTAETGQTMTVSVLNGVGTKGLAGKTAELFKGLKFADGTARYSVTNVADAPSKYEKTQVILKLPDESFVKSAEYLMSILFAGTSVNDTTGAQATDLILIIGKDFDLVTATQKAAEAAAGTSGSEGTAVTSSQDSSETTADTVAAGEVFILNILNGEGTSGIALTVKSILEKELNKGQVTIKVQETKNADNFKYTATKIITHTDKAGIKEMAESIKKTLGVGVISASSDNPDKVDITIVIGSDYTK
jgi:hypothetical protein